MKKARTKTMADFLARHDEKQIIKTRVQTALESLAKEGPEAWEYEMEFLRRAGVAVGRVSIAREMFPGHVVPLRRSRSARKIATNAWFADAKVAKAARKYVA